MAAKKTKRKKRTTTAKRKNALPRKSRKVARKRPAAKRKNSAKKRVSAHRKSRVRKTAKRKNAAPVGKPRKRAAAKRAAKRGARKGSKVAWSSGKRPRPFLVENKRRKKSKAKAKAKPRRKNPDAAAKVYEKFHGRKSETDITLIEPALKQRDEFGALGELRELCIETPTGLNVKIPFDGKKVLLCATGDSRNLYFKGGDQSIDLSQLKMDGASWRKDKMLLGVCYEITYRTQKGFDRFKTTDYYHALGEETGMKPVLSYDRLNKRLELIGGQFDIRPEGITN